MITATRLGADYTYYAMAPEGLGGGSLDDAADTIFRQITKDAEEPSDEGEEDEERESTDDDENEEASDEGPEESEDDEESETDDEDESEEEPDEDSEDTKKGKKVVLEANADAYVKAKIDGEEREISIKDLTRLYGQEAALTRKSQEAAEIKKAADTQGAKYVAGLENLVKRAQERWSPYSQINFLALTKDPDINAQELTALTSEAQKAWEDLQYLQGSLDNVLKDAVDQRRNNLMTQAKEAVKVLSDPKTGIDGWSDKLYNDIRAFAINSGLDATMVNELVDPQAIKLLHKAMLFEKGSQAAKTVTKKVDKTPKRIIKGQPEVVTKSRKPSNADAAYKKLQQSGSLDDATDAILARMGIKPD